MTQNIHSKNDEKEGRWLKIMFDLQNHTNDVLNTQFGTRNEEEETFEEKRLDQERFEQNLMNFENLFNGWHSSEAFDRAEVKWTQDMWEKQIFWV